MNTTAAIVIGIAVARELAFSFINARFSNEERHQRRLDKVGELEANPPR